MIANAKDFRIVARHGNLAVAEKLVGRRGYTVIRMVGNSMSMDLVHRPTERQARDEANRIWKEDRR